MTETNNTQSYYTNFGGLIDIDDFNTSKPNRNRINNQVDATNLPKELKQKKQKKFLEEQYKNMNLEELKEMKIISNTNGRPISNLTDEKWQKEFNVRKLFITPNNKSATKLSGKYSKESGIWNEETKGTYHGKTNWQQYCHYINDVLANIRSGQRDYCYYIYQIMDLCKFHYEDLRTKYCDGYWEVWLERQEEEYAKIK